MSNINKIKVSGQTYNIQDQNATKTVELTQAEYDALAVKDPNTFYVITDAQGADLTQYWTSAQTNSAITAAVSGKQDTLVSGTNIKTINNESILGSGNIEIEGGGKAVSGGTNISITTGETADTINCTLPITAGTGTNSIMHGSNLQAQGMYSHAEGWGSTANTECSHAEGNYVITNNKFEHSQGQYNNSVSASTTFGDSGNTLFSVGNGTANDARHNAFEIRQNGDIYLTKDGQDVKLQDQLGGGGGKAIEAGRGISVTTGETADTVSIDLPISATTGENLIIGDTSNRVNDPYNSGKSIVFGRYSTVKSYDSLVGGYYCSNEKGQSQVFGNRSKTKNQCEFGCGKYNNSVSGSSTFGDSGNTLFSVGNGTAENARHNAFEIRQNGDIYCSDGTNDVKLQDTITATAANTTALGGLKLVKLTQSEYDALSPDYDSNTLYIVTDS